MARTYLGFDSNIANRYAYASSAITDDGSGKVVFGTGSLIGVATGYQYNSNNRDRYEILGADKTWYITILDVQFGDSAASKYQTTGMTDLQKSINNQLTIMDCLNVSAAMVADLEAKGRNMDAQRQAIQYYYERLMQRNSDLADSGILQNVETANTQLTNQYGSYLQKIANGTKPLRIGVAPLVPLIIKGVIVITLAVIAYNIIRSIFVESNADLNKAQDLANTISGMDKETASKYMDYLKKLTNNGTWINLKWIAIVGGVALVAYEALPYLMKKSKKK